MSCLTLARRACLLVVWLLPAQVAAGPPSSPMKPPPDDIVSEARELIRAMTASERGPYSAIRWFCHNGAVLPPQPSACRDHGGGIQHAQYSRQRARLAELGWHVGTIFAALDWQELWHEGTRQVRLRELPVERYMIDSVDGWVLRRARHYRGRAQVEDEEKAGRELLLRVLSQNAWVAENYLLARELVRSIPHRGADSRIESARRLSQQIADLDPDFQTLRIEVHSRPTQHTAARIRQWRRTRGPADGPKSRHLDSLIAALDELYGDAGRAARLSGAEQALARTIPEAAAHISDAHRQVGTARITSLAHAMRALRQEIPARDPAFTLYRLKVMEALETELRVTATVVLGDASPTRAGLLGLAGDLLHAAWAAGWLSIGERDALLGAVAALTRDAAAPGADYVFAVRRLAVAASWAAMTVRHTFGEVLVRYAAVEPSANRFIDDLLRASVMLPLGELAHRLGVDAAALSGQSHYLFAPVASGVIGINPGVARGRLRILSPTEPGRGFSVSADDIVVLPETVAELTPVAGILTAGEGNPLSHVQMLARNLGIPNALLTPRLIDRLREADGQRVLLIVAADGRVYLERDSRAPALGRPALTADALVSAPQPDLTHTRPLPLAELHSGLSGRIVGPKAANVGELARRFPGRVAPAVAVPFGVFARHTEVERQRLAEAIERLQASGLTQTELDSMLDTLRDTIRSKRLAASDEQALLQIMTAEFGDDPGLGVFVRSDTNVEDLPQFTGAGLNETLPNVVGTKAQLAGIPQVWSSVYSRRAMAWRGRVLKDPHHVYASVLLMKSIPAEKSGVLVTANLVAPGDGLTVSVAWGVGGAVDNESAASVVLRPDGDTLLLAEAKAPYRRTLDSGGGIKWLPAPSGAVLSGDEQDQLRQLAAEVAERYPAQFDDIGMPLPWDIEFAFTGGRLWLLQIRPLVQRGAAQAASAISRVLPPAAPRAWVELSEPPAATSIGVP